jgi:hypothetical protein
MKRIKPIEYNFIGYDNNIKFEILKTKLNELISAHNERVDRWRERKSLRTDNDGIECLGVDRCQEIALLRAQVKSFNKLVIAIEELLSNEPNGITPCLDKALRSIEFELQNYKRGGV